MSATAGTGRAAPAAEGRDGAGRPAYVIAARRTPIGRVGGALRHLRPEGLVAPLLRALLDDLGAAPADVDDVVLGNAWGPGGNPARVAALAAGLEHVAGLTVDRQCASGLEAVNLAARLVAAGAVDLCLAGGVESPSTAPWRVDKPASLYATPSFSGRARFTPDSVGDPDMGPAADALAAARGVSRERQDDFALTSHRKALAAAADGRFAAETVPLPASNAAAVSGATAVGGGITADESPKQRLTAEGLARLPPAFTPGGTATAGNTAPVNDGAAVVAVASERMRRRLGAGPALRVVGTAAAGVDPALPGLGPVAAVEALLRRDGRADVAGVGLVEITEAFAGQALACLDALGIDERRVNVGGGAIALGHPWGASGAVLVVRLYTELIRAAAAGAPDRPTTALATLAGAGGLGVATLLELDP